MTQLKFLALQNFRNYSSLELPLNPGLSLICGRNGTGKTNILEAIGFLARGASVRNVHSESLIQTGQDRAVLRGEFLADNRNLLVEAELPRPPKRLRMQVNRQALPRKADLHPLIKLTTFLPSHMSLVQGGPEGRRTFLDDSAMALFPKAAGALADLQGVLRQRNALLRNAAGRLSFQAASTLDIWDAKLVDAAHECVGYRLDALAKVLPYVCEAYQQIAELEVAVKIAYQPSWSGADFARALKQSRGEDLRRGYTTVGPQRDDAQLELNNLVAKTHASQGEQRTLALAMRLALHQIQLDVHREIPLLLLDDVLSELDDNRSAKLLEALPAGQVLVTSAVALPKKVEPDAMLDVETLAQR